MLLDPHSYNDATQPETTNLEWKARVDFASRTLEGEVTLTLASAGAGPFDLDTRDLTILEAQDDSGRKLEFSLAAGEPILGARLRVMLLEGTRAVTIRYRTSPEASALQWLEPAQTLGGKQPFLFSQCQAIHARAVVPIQDTPRLRIKYRAELTIPADLRLLMAASFVSRTENGNGEATVVYEMPQPIPPYLLAFAVGDLASRDIGPRSRVWAEPGIVDAAAFEFAEVEAMIQKAESIFGPYDWERFDVLTMPPSFPYGGMENPRLTFLTPTVIAGDRSLVSVLAHELAHSWTGNLVTNANAEHFWLNEGFTVFAERRILEALYGSDVMILNAAVGRYRLGKAVERFAPHPELTRLQTSLGGVDPDEAFSDVPYEKGYLFLRAIEEIVGRQAFDGFLRGYVERFRFGAITTAQFLKTLEELLPGVAKKVGADEWIHGAGIPANAPHPRSSRLDAISALGSNAPSDELAASWTANEWALYLGGLSLPASAELCSNLETRFHLTDSHNHEILVAWLKVAIGSGFEPVIPRTEQLLGTVGRMKYLEGLYSALATSGRWRPLARQCFERCKIAYHPIARQVVEGVLRRHDA